MAYTPTNYTLSTRTADDDAALAWVVSQPDAAQITGQASPTVQQYLTARVNAILNDVLARYTPIETGATWAQVQAQASTLPLAAQKTLVQNLQAAVAATQGGS